MPDIDRIGHAVTRALGGEGRSVRVELAGDTILLTGEVPSIREKRRAPRAAAEAAGDHAVLDRITVSAGEPVSDAALLDSFLAALPQEGVFHDYRIASDTGAPAGDGRWITISVERGVICMKGAVESLSHRRFAEVLAWWQPGCVDVDNRLHVEPPELDTDGEISDAVRLVLEKDPWIDATAVRLLTRAAGSAWPASCPRSSSATWPKWMSGTFSACTTSSTSSRSRRRSSPLESPRHRQARVQS